MKKQALLLLLAVCALSVFGFSCKKGEDPITHELTLKALKPLGAENTTTFTEIKYRDANGDLQTITNSTSDFQTTFTIKSGYTVEFSVQANVTGFALPTGRCSYEIVELENGVRGDKACNEDSATVSGSSGNYKISASFNRKFQYGSCF